MKKIDKIQAFQSLNTNEIICEKQIIAVVPADGQGARLQHYDLGEGLP